VLFLFSRQLLLFRFYTEGNKLINSANGGRLVESNKRYSLQFFTQLSFHTNCAVHENKGDHLPVVRFYGVKLLFEIILGPHFTMNLGHGKRNKVEGRTLVSLLPLKRK